MPQVHFVKRAAKARKQYGIRKGDSYFWWKHRRKGSKNGYQCFSKTKPRPSQLTLSEYFRAAYRIQEEVDDAIHQFVSLDRIPEAASIKFAVFLRGLADEVRALSELQQMRANNLPESFRAGVGVQLENRAECCTNIAGELESAANKLESLSGSYEDAPIMFSDIQDALSSLSWDWEL